MQKICLLAQHTLQTKNSGKTCLLAQHTKQYIALQAVNMASKVYSSLFFTLLR
jgi:hypothetical protein